MTLKEYLEEGDLMYRPSKNEGIPTLENYDMRDFKKEALKELTKLGVKYKDGSVWIPVSLIKNERTMNRIRYWVKRLTVKNTEDRIDK